MTSEEKIRSVFLNYPATGQNESELLELVKFLEGKEINNILEIGTQFGGTFYLWQLMAKNKTISIDLPDGPFGGCNQEFVGLRNNKLAKQNSFFITGDSKSEDVKKKFLEILNGEQLDLLFIDGDHSYDGAKHDYEYYSQFVSYF